ncbi:MAG: hypothetical protein KAI73_00810 [Rhodospirillaceae bacterium]|nr:hypothetical protein [Rhodospirillaceae bacterium]
MQKQLIGLLENQSPAYAKARQEFIAASPGVNALEDSILGKLANIDDVQLKSISRRLLDPEQINPNDVLNARKAIRGVDPDAWDQIVRVEMERLMGSVREATTVGVQNEPSQIVRALFGSRKQRRIIMNAIGPENAPQARQLEVWLRRASLGRPQGSQTASRAVQMKRLGGAAFAIRDLFRRPVDALADLGEDAVLRAKTETVATLMFDPSFKGDLKAIQKLGNEEAAARMAKLLDSIVTGTTAFTTAEVR